MEKWQIYFSLEVLSKYEEEYVSAFVFLKLLFIILVVVVCMYLSISIDACVSRDGSQLAWG